MKTFTVLMIFGAVIGLGLSLKCYTCSTGACNSQTTCTGSNPFCISATIHVNASNRTTNTLDRQCYTTAGANATADQVCSSYTNSISNTSSNWTITARDCKACQKDLCNSATSTFAGVAVTIAGIILTTFY